MDRVLEKEVWLSAPRTCHHREPSQPLRLERQRKEWFLEESRRERFPGCRRGQPQRMEGRKLRGTHTYLCLLLLTSCQLTAVMNPMKPEGQVAFDLVHRAAFPDRQQGGEGREMTLQKHKEGTRQMVCGPTGPRTPVTRLVSSSSLKHSDFSFSPVTLGRLLQGLFHVTDEGAS